MRTRGKQVTISSLLILVAIAFSTTELAQGAPPKAGNKPVARVKPKEPLHTPWNGRRHKAMGR